MNPSTRTRVLARGASRTIAFALTLFFLAASALAGTTTLVTTGSTWRYLDDGSDQGTTWRAPAFDDSTWSSGPAQLGYGDGDEATVVSYGPDPNNKQVTTYFRRSFSVADPSPFAGLTLRVMRDDGAVVYLNGTEVWRSNMPAGTIGYQTFASSALGGADESALNQSSLSPSLLVAGTNVLAVEIHQANGTSSDISFDLDLVASDASQTPSLTRGPYLQDGTSTDLVVRWRTDLPSDSRVRYGSSPATLSSTADDATLTTEHVVQLTGLTANTTYYYSVGTGTTPIAGGDANHWFVTSPAAGTSLPTRVWVLGDSGTANSNAAAVRDAYYGFTGSTRTNLWLMLGDNAYNEGTDTDYQSAVFDMYPATLRTSVLWPTIGNHDTAQSSDPPASLPYFQIFTLPTAGEAGGLASGTERYYSFDYANIHFVCLDSMTSSRAPLDTMMTWLANDLASTTEDWTIAFWHHPPYTKGSHDSDTETALVEMRQNALPILESAGVDLVLTGHSHSYERSFLIDGHYGTSNTFTSSMKVDGGDGRADGNGAYEKPTLGAGPHEGAVYAVAGSSGKTSGGLLNHPAMFISLNQLGSMVIDVDGDTLNASFVQSNGAVTDHFTIVKGSAPITPPLAPSGLGASAVSYTQIDLAWTDNSDDEDGFRVERCTGTNCMSFAQIQQTAANTSGWSDATASAGTTYRYRVLAFNSGGSSGYSNIAPVTTPAPPTAPAAPSGLTGTATSATSVDLAWIDNSSNEDGFTIQRCTGKCKTWDTVGQSDADVAGFTDATATANTSYKYRVFAYNGIGNSDYSNTAGVKTPKGSGSGGGGGGHGKGKK